jgi:thiamine kinase-like enzyme
MIPDEKKPAVERALRESFGLTSFEGIEKLTTGLSSALVFRIVVRGRPYLLRVITRTDSMSDPTRQFACMKSGADAGLAPRVWYANVEDRVSITDFVEARPFSTAEALVRLPATLRALHALPPFPPMRTYSNYVDAMDAFIQKFRAAKILPESETDELFELYARIASVYPRHDSQLVSCHNDLKPENILFDGDRVWLVDWEAAFLNDPYADLAIVVNFIVTNDAEENAYLRAYFGEDPGDYRLARFYLMRQIAHMSYAAIFLLLGSFGKPIEPHAQVPSFRDFHNRIWAGEVDLGSAEAKLQYGGVHMNQALHEMRAARFDRSLRIVSARHAHR